MIKKDNMINRDEAIEVLIEKYPYIDPMSIMWTMCSLPEVQLESLRDKEQRIFLAAMGREEKVCKQVDEECGECNESHEDNLVKTCHEITRKVKGMLWS